MDSIKLHMLSKRMIKSAPFLDTQNTTLFFLEQISLIVGHDQSSVVNSFHLSCPPLKLGSCMSAGYRSHVRGTLRDIGCNANFQKEHHTY